MKRTYERPVLVRASVRLQAVTAVPGKVTGPSGDNGAQNGGGAG